MREETNLEAVKRVAVNFLYLEPKLTDLSPLVIKHPFTNCGIVCFPAVNENGYTQGNIIEDSNALNEWRKCIKDAIENAENYNRIAMLITNSYRFAFLKYTKSFLSVKDFSQSLVDFWVLNEAPNNDPNFTAAEMVKLFKTADKNILMEPDELSALADFDDTVIIYRGVTKHNENNLKALSWTVKPETAEWFAQRFGEQGKVYKAEIGKEHILAFFAHRNEGEVIVEPDYLKNIELKNDFKSDFIMEM